MNIKNLLLWEKYRPKTTKQMILLPRISGLTEYIDVNGLESNLILYGPPGTGKSTLAAIIAEQHNSITLKGKLGIDIISDKIKKHFDSLSFEFKDKPKLVYIDEFDRASDTLQDGLKSFVEEYPQYRLIFTTNHIDKINSELRSRFSIIPFDPINSDEREFLFNKQVTFLRGISKRENDDFYKDKNLMEKIVKKNFPDLRSSIEYYHLIKMTGDATVLTNDVGSDKISLYKFIQSGDINPITNYDYVINNFFITYDDAFKYLSRPFFEYLKDNDVNIILNKGAKILEKQKEYNSLISTTPDPLILLVNYILDLKNIILG